MSGVSTRLRVKVVPGASRSGIAGWLGEALKVRVAAPPEKGRANAAVLAIISEALCLPAADVRIVAGPGSPQKLVEIRGLPRAEIRARLDGAIGRERAGR